MAWQPRKQHRTKWGLALEIFKVLGQHSQETALNLANRGHREFTALMSKSKLELEELYAKARRI